MSFSINTFLLYITERSIIGRVVRTATQRNLVVHNRSILVLQFLLPVGIDAGNSREIRVLTCVGSHFIHQHLIIRTTQQIHLLGRILNTVRKFIVQSSLPFSTLLRSYQHNTVSTTGSVNSGGSCVFQHFNRLNIRRIQMTDTTFRRHAVYYIKRIGVVDRTGTPNTNL